MANRPCAGCGDPADGPQRILMDDVWIGPTGGDAVYQRGFSRDEGFLMLAGQKGWEEPAGAHTATANTFETGVREPQDKGVATFGFGGLPSDPGYVELYGADDSSPSRPFPNTTGDTRFEAWFNRVGTLAVEGRPGHSGLQVALGNDSFDLDEAAAFITTRDTDHAIHYQRGPDGEMAIGPIPPDAGWWGVAADLHWDEAAGRFTSWDFSYQQTDQKGDNWQLIAEGLGFRSQDGQGYDHDLNGLMTWNRPCVECGDSDGFGPNRILMDRILIEGVMVSSCNPGDIDCDGDVDFTNFSVLAGNFTGTLDPGTGPKTRDNGDFDGDADVDFGDFSVLARNFTGTITAAASARTVADDGNIHLEIDLTNDGAMTLQPNNANLAGYSIRSRDSQLMPDADGAAAPFMFYLLNEAQEVTAGSVGATTILSEDLALDISFAGDADQTANVVSQYTRAGDVTPVDGVVHAIPEPATMMLLAASGLLLNRHRSA